LIVAFTPGGSFGVRIDQAEIEGRFTPQWDLLSAGDEPETVTEGKYPIRHYLLQRRV